MKNIIFFTILLSFVNTCFASDWTYSKNTDEMRDKISHSAKLKSDNKISFSKPFDGGAALEIIVFSDDDKVSGNVGVRLTKGIFSCPKNELCDVSVRFDNGDVEKLYTKVVGDSHDLMVVLEPLSFIQKVNTSKRIYIEIPVYNEGKPQFKFSSNHLKWQVIEENKPFLSSIGTFNLLERQSSVGGRDVKVVGKGCYLVKDFIISKSIRKIGTANICTFNGMIYLVGVSYPYERSLLNDLYNVINKELGAKSNDDYPMWLSEETKGISSIMIANHKGKDISLSFTFNPEASKVPGGN